MSLTLDAPVDQRLNCPVCSRPLTELGFLFSGRRFVPREIASLKGFRIDGTLEGVQYACGDCRREVLIAARGPMD